MTPVVLVTMLMMLAWQPSWNYPAQPSAVTHISVLSMRRFPQLRRRHWQQNDRHQRC
jgi:hypothetical protein